MPRRCLVLIAVTVALALAGCGSDTEGGNTAGESTPDDGPWSYTDGSGKTVELEKTPKRIIAHAGEAAALMSFGIKPVGIYADESVETDPSLKGLDLTGIEILGEEWGKIDTEKASLLDPDLVVASWWPAEKAYSGFEEGVDEKSKKLADLVPVVGVSHSESLLSIASGYEELAESLGADVEDPAIAAERKRFETALDAFKAATAAKPGLTALAVYPDSDLLYVANPTYSPELLDFQKWGLGVIDPDSPDPEFPYWENLSWENADKYQPDLILWDSRAFTDTINEEFGNEQPTWFDIRAAKAGQVAKWPGWWITTYAAYATELETLTETINEIDAGIGD